MLTPKEKNELISKLYKMQGIGLPWGEKPNFMWNEEITINGAILACSCCGIRNMDTGGDYFNRTYKEVDVEELKDKLQLREGDQDIEIED